MTQAGAQTGSLCRVCGFENNPVPEAQVIKCECCGVRLGLEDQRASDVANWRAKWLSKGGKWQGRPRDPQKPSATDAAE